MNLAQFLHPSPIGFALAALAVIAGAPLFSDGMRALRLRRRFAALTDSNLGAHASGFTHVQGQVVLESPLFAPLSSRPCAGYRLEVRAVGIPLTRSFDIRRPFRLVAEGAMARVVEEGADWRVGVTAEREVAASTPLSESLNQLLERIPELGWWRRSGGTIVITEHALCAEAACHVVGTVRSGRSFDAQSELELLRTGTDDVRATVGGSAAGALAEPDLWINAGEHLDYLLVSDQPPAPTQLAMPVRRTIGVLLGPALSMMGLLYLASAVDYLRALGRL